MAKWMVLSHTSYFTGPSVNRLGLIFYIGTDVVFFCHKINLPPIPQMTTVDNGFIAPFINKQSQTESEASITEHSYV